MKTGLQEDSLIGRWSFRQTSRETEKADEQICSKAVRQIADKQIGRQTGRQADR
jgi:hypothetical protein